MEYSAGLVQLYLLWPLTHLCLQRMELAAEGEAVKRRAKVDSNQFLQGSKGNLGKTRGVMGETGERETRDRSVERSVERSVAKTQTVTMVTDRPRGPVPDKLVTQTREGCKMQDAK